MTEFSEQAVRFDCEGEVLVGVVSAPAAAPATDVGLLIVVGGPQYRVGAHRQFVELARHVARAGYAAMRFDARGMGDSTGETPGFDGQTPDIDSAIQCLQRHAPSVRRVLLWGLCDGASACAIYMADTQDPRVAGLAMLNPWIRSSESLARSNLRHWYPRRLVQSEFWKKLLTGRVRWRAALEVLQDGMHGLRRWGAGERADFRSRMLEGLKTFAGVVWVHLSDKDQTAREFSDVVSSSTAWQALKRRPSVQFIPLPNADHTLSTPAARRMLEADVVRLLKQIADGERGRG